MHNRYCAVKLIFINILILHAFQAAFSILEDEFIALKNFYNDTNGNDWYIKRNWEFAEQNNNITANDICVNINPYGLQCSVVTNTISNNTHIIGIDFVDNNLNGTIGNSISNLSYLISFRIIDAPKLTGPFPQTFYNRL